MYSKQEKFTLTNVTHFIYNAEVCVGEGRFIRDDLAVFFYPGVDRLIIPYDFWKNQTDTGTYAEGNIVFEWIADRVIPPNRMNIDEILQKLGMPEYDELEMFLRVDGKFVGDDLRIALK